MFYVLEDQFLGPFKSELFAVKVLLQTHCVVRKSYKWMTHGSSESHCGCGAFLKKEKEKRGVILIVGLLYYACKADKEVRFFLVVNCTFRCAL